MRTWILAALFCVSAGCSAPRGRAATPDVVPRANGDDPGADPGGVDPGDVSESSGHRGFPRLLPASTAGTLSPMRLVVIVAAGDPMQNDLFAFADAAITSDWYKTVTAEYGVLPPTAPAVHLTGAPLPTVTPALTSDAVAAYVNATLAATTNAPTPDGKTLYLVYLPPGVSLENNVLCKGPGAAAYHLPFGDGGDGFAVVQRCQIGFETQLQQLTVVGSHEIAEAATDTGAGWRVAIPPSTVPVWMSDPWLEYEDNRVTENGDLCIDTRILEGGYYYQRAFSNAAAAAGGDPCVPSLGLPYYAATTDKAWYSGIPGETMRILVSGWSTAPMDDWVVRARVQEVSRVGAAWSAAQGAPALNDGKAVSFTITIPADATPGDWASFYLLAEHLDAQKHVLPGDDYAHLQMFGVYVR